MCPGAAMVLQVNLLAVLEGLYVIRVDLRSFATEPCGPQNRDFTS